MALFAFLAITAQLAAFVKTLVAKSREYTKTKSLKALEV